MPFTAVIAADIPAPSRREIANICEAELHATLAVLRQLDAEQWNQPTACPGWTVRDVGAHLLGQYESQANPVAAFRRLRAARRNYPSLPRLAGQNQQQIDDLRHLTTSELVAAIAQTGPRAIRAVERTPALIRHLGTRRIFPEEQLVDPHLGYIMDVLTSRDPWMHRVDICRATRSQLDLDDHDRVIIEQVLGELGRGWTHEALLLHLAYPIDGSWLLASGNTTAQTEVRADPVELMRVFAGRVPHSATDWQVEGNPQSAAILAGVRMAF